jgi:hypothetical protein
MRVKGSEKTNLRGRVGQDPSTVWPSDAGRGAHIDSVLGEFLQRGNGAGNDGLHHGIDHDDAPNGDTDGSGRRRDEYEVAGGGVGTITGWRVDRLGVRNASG